MPREHTYHVQVDWTGNTAGGTANYRDYNRSHDVSVEGLPVIAGSADPTFRGDPGCWNPEQLLVAALAHMLSYLAECSLNGVVVTGYSDSAVGTMTERASVGQFTEVVLHPRVTVAQPEMLERARELHTRAHQICFIANSVNFPVRHKPEVSVGS